MHFKSATLKLTLFYVLIAMAVSVAFSIALFNISSNELDKGLGRQAKVIRDIQIGDMQSFESGSDFEQSRLDFLNEANNHLKNNLIYFNLLILLLSSGAGYFLARWTLKPIEEAMESQNRFTADASHELRTPITAMRTEIEVALRDKKFNLLTAKKLLESNLEETSKLESLSSALLKLARFGEDARKTFRTFSLSETIVEAYEKVGSLAEAKSITFENDIRNIKVAGDKQSLVELFVILLDNAIKYSPKKSMINISMFRTDGHVLIRIRDHGMGIKACDLPHIFDRFYRADHSRSKEKANGYGLGLSIAKNIVDLHNGSIAVRSTAGKGSEFIVKLKVAKS